MCCSKCCVLVIQEHEEYRCLNCGNRPFERLITVKCASVECRQLPEINGYCASCWHSRKRSELTDQERSKRYRERMREKQRTRRARKKGAVCSESSTIIDNPCGSSPEAICAGAMSVEPGGLINLAE